MQTRLKKFFGVSWGYFYPISNLNDLSYCFLPPPVRVYVAFSDILMPEELPLSFIIPHPLPNVSSIYFLLSFIFGGSSVKEFSTTVKLLSQVWQLDITLKPP